MLVLVVIVGAEHYSESCILALLKNVVKVGAHDLVVVAEAEIAHCAAVFGIGHPFEPVAVAYPDTRHISLLLGAADKIVVA